MYNRTQVFLFIITMLIAGSVHAGDKEKNSVKAYPAPAGAIQNTDFTVKVRVPGQPWQDLPEYLVKVDQVKGTAHKEENASMSYFDFAGEAEVTVTFNKGAVQTARVRPLSYNIKHDIKGNTITFKLFKPANLSIEVNGDIFHNLQLFANPVDDFVPNAKDTNLLYYGPGVHEIPGGKLRVPSGKTLYLAGGAVLKGQVLIQGVRNVRVAGSGMVDQSVKMGVRIANSKNVTVEGIFCTQCFTGGSDSVTIRNVKAISYYGWGDGMNVIASNNVLIDGVFNRNSDDCTTVYGTRLGFTGACKNVTMQNSTLWADVGHPILVGTHGNTPNPEVLENLNYINIDILDHKEAQLDYQGCLSLNAGDNNLIKNVRFENIRVEDFRQGQLVNIRVFFNAKYCTSPGRGVEDVLFKDITYNGNNAVTSIIAGYNESRKVKNIIFENLNINGTTITDDMPGKPKWYKTGDMAKIFVGEHVEGVVFRKAPTDKSVAVQKVFVHPGILHSKAGLDHIYAVAQKKTMPEYGSYELLKSNPLASAQYKMNGPYKVISRDGEFRYTKSKMEADFSAAYLNALMWVATKDEAHARQSLAILEAYADSLTLIPSTNDAPLLAGLEGVKIVNAMEILRYTWKGMAPKQMDKINNMIRNIFLPVCEKFYSTSAYTNGNWGPIVTKMYISSAIWFNDEAMYKKAIDFYNNANDNGTILNYISGTTGQIQESGRDQGHCQLGIGALATVCEIAWNQHDDLYSALDNRLLKGFEYVAKYNLGNNVPFETWKDITGKYSNWTVISDKGRGRFIPIYEMVYNHYVHRKGLSMPYTEQVIKKIRPEGYDRDQPAFGTLLFYGTGNN